MVADYAGDVLFDRSGFLWGLLGDVFVHHCVLFSCPGFDSRLLDLLLGGPRVCRSLMQVICLQQPLNNLRVALWVVGLQHVQYRRKIAVGNLLQLWKLSQQTNVGKICGLLSGLRVLCTLRLELLELIFQRPAYRWIFQSPSRFLLETLRLLLGLLGLGLRRRLGRLQLDLRRGLLLCP